MTHIRRRPDAPRGFTLVEMSAVIAIVAVLAALTINGMGALRESVRRRSQAADLYSALELARTRALSRQRTQVVYIDAAAGTNGVFGFFSFEDATTPPNLFTATQLATLVGTLDPSDVTTAPAPFTLRRLDDVTGTYNPFFLDADAWQGKPLPFPWGALAAVLNGPISTAGGCTFCTAGNGAVALLPNGKAIFSDANVIGGMVVLRQVTPNNVTRVTGVGIAASGFAQLVEPQ